MGAAAEQHEKYRGYLIGLRHDPGLGWIVQWADPMSRRERCYSSACPTPGYAAAVAYRAIDQEYRRDADEVCAAAFGPRKGWL